ncbi:MAG: hypothetical protein PHQ43_07005 [Dehalococcoidales bacterium]|nr:hypothetical protein [Dehalococcoidales bacterium]
MIDTESLETLSASLGVKSRIVKADIKDLARSWEEPLRDARFADPRLAFYVLKAVARAYLRGRNLRMGNSQGLHRHQSKEAMLMRILVRYVAGDSAFESLHETGVTSMESFASALSSYFDIADEANQILHEGENHERG